MYHLSACDTGLFKRYYWYVSFLPSENSFRCYEKYCQFHLYIFLKKNSLVKKYENQICYKENKSLFF